jgi:hypothetical protein
MANRGDRLIPALAAKPDDPPRDHAAVRPMRKGCQRRSAADEDGSGGRPRQREGHCGFHQAGGPGKGETPG